MKNRSKITIKGLNQERAINHLVKHVKIFNFKREDNNISHFEVEYKNRNKVKKMLDKHNIEIVALSNFGIVNFFTRLIKSYGVMIGLALSVALYAGQYNFILKIEVFGAKNGLSGEIMTFVDDLLSSKLKSQIDTLEVEKQVRDRYAQISSVSVAIIGQSLVINVNEVDVPEEMSGKFLPMVSEYDGRVNQIQLIQGTLAVNEGDIVKKGDVLVYPYIFDSQGNKIDTQPKADIYADVWLIGEEVHHDYTIQTQRTGAKAEINEVYLNNLLIYSSAKEKIFDNFEVECCTKPLTKNIVLPLNLKKITMYEVQTIEVKEDFSQVKSKIIENARQKALIFLQENEIIKEENVNVREGNGWHQVSYVITLQRNIGG
ncbi:MAG: sporulation protein YqfD [Clostridia bacterium]|nr:sporulation protein YqfD [Clostridia bacterium]